MATVKDFEELSIYQKARALAKQVYDITRTGEFRYDTRLFNRFVPLQVLCVIILLRDLNVKEIRSL